MIADRKSPYGPDKFKVINIIGVQILHHASKFTCKERFNNFTYSKCLLFSFLILDIVYLSVTITTTTTSFNCQSECTWLMAYKSQTQSSVHSAPPKSHTTCQRGGVAKNQSCWWVPIRKQALLIINFDYWTNRCTVLSMNTVFYVDNEKNHKFSCLRFSLKLSCLN